MLPLVKRALAALLFLALAAGCREEPTYEGQIRAWQARRAQRLQTETGWLSLVGLYWLDPGSNSFGSDRSNKIVMPPKAPPAMGTLTLEEGSITLEPNADAGITLDGKPVTTPLPLRHDAEEGGPTVLSAGTLSFHTIKRGDRYGIRVRDPQSEARTHFRGLEYYPISERWQVRARFEAYDPPKKIPIANIVGITTEEVSPGALVFSIDGTTHRLDPILEQGSDELFIIFKDPTSQDTTYPAGRYLYASPPGPDGTVIVDFNKAYNPPCAFTDFATCPLPPPQNRLPVRVEAGEKKYAGGHG